jgi:glycosyltransferase involved in cell wall biosynthesis
MEPRFSVLVPVYEQWDLVPALLACLRAQTLPQDQFEVILSDNGSTHFAPPQALPPNVRIVTCAQPGSYAARNAAAAEARGQWFAFTDADCLPHPDWLAALAAEETDGRTLLVGAVDIKPAGNPPNAYEVYDALVGIPQERYVSRGYGATANLAVPADLFHRAGGFDAMRLSGGDAEFCSRARKHGATVRFVATACVDHPARDTWELLATKTRRMVGGQVRVGSTARRVYRVLRVLVPPFLRCMRIARTATFTPRQRLAAIDVQLRLWFVGIAETMALLAGRPPERR